MFWGIVVFWEISRNRKKNLQNLILAEKDLTKFKIIKRTYRFYKILLSFLSLIVIVFCYLPAYYSWFIPFFSLNPILNIFGLLLLNLSLIWIIVAQLYIDKELFKISIDSKNVNLIKLFFYSNKMLTSGILLMFVGFFLSITSLSTLIICILAFLIFFYNRSKHANGLVRYS